MQSHASVAEYIAAQPRNRQAILKKVRATIRKAAGAGGGVDVLNILPSIFGPGSQYQNVDALPGNGAALTLWPGTGAPNGKVDYKAIKERALAALGVSA